MGHRKEEDENNAADTEWLNGCKWRQTTSFFVSNGWHSDNKWSSASAAYTYFKLSDGIMSYMLYYIVGGLLNVSTFVDLF